MPYASGLLLATTAALAAPPNIVFILTDDQDLLLGSLDFMPAVKELLVEGGGTMGNHFTSTRDPHKCT